MATTTIPALSWDSLQATKPWQALTSQQRIWCLAWLTNGHDAIAATEIAYRCSSPKNAACMSYEIRRHKNVVTFLEFYEVLTEGAPSREVQIAGALQTLREVPVYEQVKARRLLAQLTGCVVKSDSEDGEPAEVSAQSFPIGSIIVQDGKKYQVKAEEI